MTIAERVVYEKLHGRGSAPAPREPEPKTLDDLRRRVDSQVEDLHAQQTELAERRVRLEAERRRMDGLRREISTPNEDAPLSNAPSGEQFCVSPAYALKRFFLDWTPTGRSSRAEVWWVVLFIQIPITIVSCVLAGAAAIAWMLGQESAVCDIGLLMLVGILSLVLGWPTACLEGRRLHDLGCSAVWGMLLVLVPLAVGAVAWFHGVNPLLSLLDVVVFVATIIVNVTPSQRCRNPYGDVPHVR